MRNEIVASKLNYIGDLHKLFHHDCQLVCSFLGVSRVSRMTIRQRQAQSQFTGGVQLVAQPVGSSRKYVKFRYSSQMALIGPLLLNSSPSSTMKSLGEPTLRQLKMPGHRGKRSLSIMLLECAENLPVLRDSFNRYTSMKIQTIEM